MFSQGTLQGCLNIFFSNLLWQSWLASLDPLYSSRSCILAQLVSRRGLLASQQRLFTISSGNLGISIYFVKVLKRCFTSLPNGAISLLFSLKSIIESIDTSLEKKKKQSFFQQGDEKFLNKSQRVLIWIRKWQNRSSQLSFCPGVTWTRSGLLFLRLILKSP